MNNGGNEDETKPQVHVVSGPIEWGVEEGELELDSAYVSKLYDGLLSRFPNVEFIVEVDNNLPWGTSLRVSSEDDTWDCYSSLDEVIEESGKAWEYVCENY